MGTRIYSANNLSIKEVYRTSGHGNVLYIELSDMTQLIIWAFKKPDRLQVVHYDPQTRQIISDNRHDDCKEYTEKLYAEFAKRQPPIMLAEESPFKTYHNPD